MHQFAYLGDSYELYMNRNMAQRRNSIIFTKLNISRRKLYHEPQTAVPGAGS